MRQYCKHCHFPAKTCLCSAVKRVHSTVKVVVIQHPKEVHHAKNTVRLLKLSLQNFTVLVEDEKDFRTQLINCLSLAAHPAVIYPSPSSQPLEQINRASNHDLFILLDGSWKQAYGMWCRNAQLHHLPQYHFATPPDSTYSIRHTQRAKSLSTLEAVAYTLSVSDSCDVTPLHNLQNAMQVHWQGPSEHQR
ncbi:tRNA-uridine aminocarboxypropyltransferase [Alteromonas sp. C1M14]|uniref:tRNA-uridine aminocarboxypropyltransferase n=1 Tax=Alteromonas sp. C1M14 TaxID=2841567 RepID=UPI001C0A18BA|nr:tRNA-uridine aminocarboxypropyltransferase [Alteromonas sp. C1M14]MBU2978418.1 DTW domain-containing protein [Alteromonas sp. C1M14]